MDTKKGFSTEAYTVHGGTAHEVEVWQLMPGTAVIDLLGPEDEAGTRFLAYVDDPHMYPWSRHGRVRRTVRYSGYQLGAIAVDLDVYDSVEAWRAEHPPARPGDPWVGPRFHLSPWLFALSAGDATAEEANPITVFKAIIRHVELVTNALTGIPWCRANADCGFNCVLALPARMSPMLHPGVVVDGHALLTGTSGFWGPPGEER